MPEEGIEPTLPLGERDFESHVRVCNDRAISGNSRLCSAKQPTHDCLGSPTYAICGRKMVTEESHGVDPLRTQKNPMCDISHAIQGQSGDHLLTRC